MRLDVQAVVEKPGGRDLIQGCTPFPTPPEGADYFDPVTGTSTPCP
ncbi:MAG: hypothetical protein M3307_04855 [Thermoproteota archaeon]|nr:hypothetical protein [Thermoproteota archaeon]